MKDAETAAREHAARVIRTDPHASDDLASSVQLTPPDLLERLAGWRFDGFELVAHARIGAHHVFKTKYVGPTTVVVQAHWAQNAVGVWQILDAEIARLEVREGPSGCSAPS